MPYHTVQKQTLITYLRQHADAAFTVEELAAILHGEHAPGKSTLYRLITGLVESGEVKRFVRGNSRQFVYQAIGCAHADTHLHMKCVGCGKLYHLDDDVSAAIVKTVLQSSAFSVDGQQTVLFGRCGDCKEKNASC